MKTEQHSNYVEHPLRDVLASLLGVEPPQFIRWKQNTTELSDEEFFELQCWCASNARPSWSTGIAIIEAADSIVNEALNNANICTKSKCTCQF